MPRNTTLKFGDGTDVKVELEKRALKTEVYNKTEVDDQVTESTVFHNPEGFAESEGTTTAVGSLPKGTLIHGMDMETILGKVLFTYQKPAWSSFTSNWPTQYEVGDSTPASITFNWAASNAANIKPNSIAILNASNGNAVIADNLPYSPANYTKADMGPITKNTAGNQIFRIRLGMTEGSEQPTRDVTINWYWRYYWWFDENVGTVPTPEEIATMFTSAEVRAKWQSGNVNMTNGKKLDLNVPAGSRRFVLIYPNSVRSMQAAFDNTITQDIRGSFVEGAMEVEGSTPAAKTTYRVFVNQMLDATPAASWTLTI